jgi:hypothetical protein
MLVEKRKEKNRMSEARSGERTITKGDAENADVNVDCANFTPDMVE